MEARITSFFSRGTEYRFGRAGSVQPNQNYFTVLIGENGSGKTRLLKKLVLALTEGVKGDDYINVARRLGQTIYDFNLTSSGVEVSNNGVRRLDKVYKNYVISFTASVTDKLPSQVNNRFCEYVYLGPNSYEKQHRTLSAMTSFLDDIIDKEIDLSSILRRVPVLFDYLNFLPKISVHWKVLQCGLDKLKDSNTQQRAFKRFINESDSSKFISGCDLNELCTYYFDLWKGKQIRNRSIKVTCDFNHQNIKGLKKSLDTYRMLSSLSKLGLLDVPNVGLHNYEGKEVSSVALSSGESAIITSLLRLVPLVRKGSLIFLDEPELSLHPKWQSDYIHVLDRVLGEYGCHVFLATHSHLLISDLPSSNSEVLHLTNGGKEWLRFNHTNGLSAEEILLDVFGLPTSRNHYLNQRMQRMLILLSENKTDCAEFKALISQIRKVKSKLRDEDPLKLIIDSIENGDNNGND
ncbi:AAA family ATPase [Vibrio owensii]|uniref:AAA family ATPase n=1 Tax=Vibrio owensii TaxID=696485 RepID=UPI004068284A